TPLAFVVVLVVGVAFFHRKSLPVIGQGNRVRTGNQRKSAVVRCAAVQQGTLRQRQAGGLGQVRPAVVAAAAGTFWRQVAAAQKRTHGRHAVRIGLAAVVCLQRIHQLVGQLIGGLVVLDGIAGIVFGGKAGAGIGAQ